MNHETLMRILSSIHFFRGYCIKVDEDDVSEYNKDILTKLNNELFRRLYQMTDEEQEELKAEIDIENLQQNYMLNEQIKHFFNIPDTDYDELEFEDDPGPPPVLERQQAMYNHDVTNRRS